MRQSSYIFGVLLFAFVIYITLRGQLPAYFDLFRGKATSATTPNNSNASATDAGPGIVQQGSDVLNNVLKKFGLDK